MWTRVTSAALLICVESNQHDANLISSRQWDKHSEKSVNRNGLSHYLSGQAFLGSRHFLFTTSSGLRSSPCQFFLQSSPQAGTIALQPSTLRISLLASGNPARHVRSLSIRAFPKTIMIIAADSRRRWSTRPTRSLRPSIQLLRSSLEISWNSSGE